MAVRFSADGEDYTRTVSLGAVTQFSFACWVKISADRNASTTIWQLTDGLETDYVHLRTGVDGTSVSFQQVPNAVSGTLRGTRNLTVGTWYYIAVSINGANGVMLTRAATDTSFTASTWANGPAGGTVQNQLLLGESYDTLEWLNGCLAAVKWWTTNLSQAELEAEYGFYQPRRTTGLKGWWPFTRNENVDYSGNGQTLSGGANTSVEDGPPIAWRPTRRKVHIPLSVGAQATPGPVTAPWSVPAPAVSLGAGTHPGPITAPWSIPAPDVFVGTSPPTQVQPSAIVAPWTIPTPAVSVSVNVRPAPILAAWSIPGPDVTVPINPGDDLDGPAQISYNGFKLGGGSPYLWVRLAGGPIDMPGVDNGNVPHASEDGAESGEKFAQARIVAYEMKVDVTLDTFDEIAFDLLEGLPLPEADEELPLAIRVKDRILFGYAACLDRKVAADMALRDGFVPGNVMWEKSDPRWYDRELQDAEIPDGGTIDVNHAGNTTTKPIIRLRGPATKPRLEIERLLPDGSTDLRVLEFDVGIMAGQALIVDVQELTATIGGTSYMNALTGASVAVKDWVLGRGDSSISYETADGGAPPALVFWRHAWI